MTEISRRLFLIGSAAAIATVAIPFATPIPALAPYKVRRIFAINIIPNYVTGEPDSYVSASVSRIGGMKIFDQAINARCILRWSAMPVSAIIVTDKYPIELALTSKYGMGRIDLECEDTVDEGPPISLTERHNFRDGIASTEILYTHTDNSLEARIWRRDNPPDYDEIDEAALDAMEMD